MALYFGNSGKYKLGLNGEIFGVSVPKTEKKHGLYYNQPYNSVYLNNSLVFDLNGTFYLYENGYCIKSDKFEVDGNTITIYKSYNGTINVDIVLTISQDGSEIIYGDGNNFRYIFNTQKHDFYFGEPYYARSSGVLMQFILYENGSAIVTDGNNIGVCQYMPEGTFTYVDSEIIMNFEGDTIHFGYLSLDGTQVIMTGEDPMILTKLTFNNNLLFNQPYTCITDGMTNLKIVFNDMSQAWQYDDEVLVDTANFVINNDGTISFGEEIAIVSEDGSSLTLTLSDGMILEFTTNTEQGSIRYGKKYTAFMEGATVSLTLNEDGSGSIVTPDGTEEFPAGFFVYLDDMVLLDNGDGTYTIIYVSNDGTQLIMNDGILTYQDIITNEGVITTYGSATSKSGDGWALYNQRVLPNIESVWTDKDTYPDAMIYGGYIDGYGSYYMLVVHQGNISDGLYSDSYFNLLGDAKEYKYVDGEWHYVGDIGTDISMEEISVSQIVWSSSDITWGSEDKYSIPASDTPTPLDSHIIIDWDGNAAGMPQSTEIEPNIFLSQISEFVDVESAKIIGYSNEVINNNAELYENVFDGWNWTLYEPIGMSGGIEYLYATNKHNELVGNSGIYLIPYIYQQINPNAFWTIILKPKNILPTTYGSAKASKGDGFSLYNGVKLPNIIEDDSHPYVRIRKSYTGIDGCYLYILQAFDKEDFPNANCKYYISIDEKTYNAILQYEDGQSLINSLNLKIDTWVLVPEDMITGDTTDGVWSNFDYQDYINGYVIIPASEPPIPLNGMAVIEWDGDETGLEVDDTGYCYKVADYSDSSNAIGVVIDSGYLEVLVGDGYYFKDGEYLGVGSWQVGDMVLASNTGSNGVDGIYFGKGDGVYTSLLAYTPANS